MARLNELRVARELLLKDLEIERGTGRLAGIERGELLVGVLEILISSPHLQNEDAWRAAGELLVGSLIEPSLYAAEDGSPALFNFPAPTNWKRAEADEVWELTFVDSSVGPFTFDGTAFIGRLRPGGGDSYLPGDDRIVSGRRVWEPRS